MYLEKRDIITAILIIALFTLFDGCEKIKDLAGYSVVEKETTTTVDYVTKNQLDSLTDLIIENQKATPQRIVIQNGSVKPVEDDYELSPIEIDNGDEVKDIQKYQDTTKLGNGTIFSEIYADNLYGKKFSLATTDTIVNKTTLEKRTIVRSGFFWGLGTTLGLDARIKDIEATINYTHKNKFYLEGGLQYDVDPLIELNPYQRAGVKLKVGLNF